MTFSRFRAAARATGVPADGLELSGDHGWSRRDDRRPDRLRSRRRSAPSPDLPIMREAPRDALREALTVPMFSITMRHAPRSHRVPRSRHVLRVGRALARSVSARKGGGGRRTHGRTRRRDLRELRGARVRRPLGDVDPRRDGARPVSSCPAPRRRRSRRSPCASSQGSAPCPRSDFIAQASRRWARW